MLLGPGWLLLAYLVYAQAIPAFDYDLGVSMGTQEPAEQVTAVGVAFWYGFALAAALGITVYWPSVCLAAIIAAHDAPGWSLPTVRWRPRSVS